MYIQGISSGVSHFKPGSFWFMPVYILPKKGITFIIWINIDSSTLEACTLDTIYILNLIINRSNLSLKITLLFFKIFSFIIYTLLHVFKPFVIAYSAEIFPKILFECINSFFCRLNHTIYFWWMRTKRSDSLIWCSNSQLSQDRWKLALSWRTIQRHSFCYSVPFWCLDQMSNFQGWKYK